jgi:integrase
VTSKRGYGEGEIRQRADGRWEARLQLKRAGGVESRQSVYGNTRPEVVRKLRALQQQAENGTLAIDNRVTVAAFLDRWLEEVVRPNRQLRTYEGYKTNIHRHIVSTIGHIQLTRLRAVHVQKLISRLREEGLAPRTVQYCHATVRAALAVARRWGLVTVNVATLVEPVSAPRTEFVPFTPEEAQLVLAVAEQHRLAAFFTVAMAVGLRPSEALGLTWDDVDLDNRLVRVRKALERRGGAYTFKEPKSRTSRRTIALPSICVDALLAHRRRQAVERLAAGAHWQAFDLVFTTPLGTPLNRTEMSRQFTKILEAACVEHRRLYDCRHTAATLLLAQGIPARVVMETLGHSSIALTMNTYTHVLPSLLRDAADAMDRALGHEGRQEPADG